MAHEVLEEPDELGMQITARIANATYEDLISALGGMSKSLVSQGLQRLEQAKLIERLGSHQKRQYKLAYSPRGWFKLPCQAVVKNGSITPFRSLSLRSRYSLYALKIYLYLAARRDNKKAYSLASYETISQSTGVPERHIRKALIVLSFCGLLADVRREKSDADGPNFGPNMYYLNGHQQLFLSSANTPASSVGGATGNTATSATPARGL